MENVRIFFKYFFFFLQAQRQPGRKGNIYGGIQEKQGEKEEVRSWKGKRDEECEAVIEKVKFEVSEDEMDDNKDEEFKEPKREREKRRKSKEKENEKQGWSTYSCSRREVQEESQTREERIKKTMWRLMLRGWLQATPWPPGHQAGAEGREGVPELCSFGTLPPRHKHLCSIALQRSIGLQHSIGL